MLLLDKHQVQQKEELPGDFLGVYQGVQESYYMKNQYGDDMIVAGKRILVVNMRLTGLSLSEFLGGEQTSQLEFFSDSTAITGKWQATFNWWMDVGYNPDGHFQTEKGEALQYKLTDTRTSGGSKTAGLEIMISYIEK